MTKAFLRVLVNSSVTGSVSSVSDLLLESDLVESVDDDDDDDLDDDDDDDDDDELELDDECLDE